MKPLVSILIPAFNAQSWIAEALHSAITQTWERKEIIVVDDGSTDRTLDIVRQFESSGVRAVSQKNLGAAAARNKAFSLSQGDYIQWLDADDLLAPDKIEKQMAPLLEAKSKRTLYSSAWGQFMYRHHRASFIPTALWCDLSPKEWLLRKMGQNLHMQTATWLVSRDLCLAAGPWNTQMLTDDDGEYFCRVLLASDGVRFVPESKVYYRATGPSSLSYIGKSSRKLEAQWGSMMLHMDYLLSLENTARSRAACVSYMRNWQGFFYPHRPDLVKQMQEKAAQLGGKLDPPTLSWKYSWIEPILGSTLAWRAKIFLPRLKWSVVRIWDKALFRITSRSSSFSAQVSKFVDVRVLRAGKG